MNKQTNTQRKEVMLSEDKGSPGGYDYIPRRNFRFKGWRMGARGKYGDRL